MSVDMSSYDDVTSRDVTSLDMSDRLVVVGMRNDVPDADSVFCSPTPG